MKFKWLEVKNLASLKGEHLIDFESLSVDGLFSIVGPTGSGKSTILNAISLSLFGQVYKKSLIQTDLITLGCSRAYSKLAFTLYDQDYISLWESRTLKKDGTPLKNPITIKELYVFKEGKKIPTNKTIEDLLGLDFNQFSKTIILNQGEFAKFLMSSFSERKDILEKLCHLEELKNLGKELNLEINDINLLKNEKESTLKTYLSDFTPIEPVNEALLIVKDELSFKLLKQKKLNNQADILNQIEKISENHRVKTENIITNNALIKETLNSYEKLEEKKFNSEKIFNQKKEELKSKTPILTNKIKIKEALTQKEMNFKNLMDSTKKVKRSLDEQIQNLEFKRSSFSETKDLIIKFKNNLKTDLFEQDLRELIKIDYKKNEYLKSAFNTISTFLKDLREINDNLVLFQKPFADIKNLENKNLAQTYKKLNHLFNDTLLKMMEHMVSKDLHLSDCPLCEQSIDTMRYKQLQNRLNVLKKNKDYNEVDYQKQIKNEQLFIEKLLAQISFMISKLSTIDLDQWYEIRKQDTISFSLNLNDLEEELKNILQINKLKHDHTLHQEQEKNIEYQIKQNKLILEENQYAIKKSDQEIQALKKELGEYLNTDPEKTLNQLQAQVSNFENLKNKDLYDFTQAKEKLSSLKEKNDFLQDQVKDFDMTYNHLKSRLESKKFPDTISELDHEFLKISVKDFEQEIVIIDNDVNDLSKRVGNFEQKIQSLNIIKSKMNDVKRELKELEDNLGPKMILSDLLSRDEFRNFVLKRVEDILIKQANFELKSLCDNRYQIIVKASKSRINEFYILDRFKEGLNRKIETLSGGETFMASLAMAMGLSELSRGSTEINAFFIDEGFATLDEDALDDVMDLLLRIKSRGKQVGVISHVEKLMQRIPSSLILKKAADGNSHLKMELGF